MVYPYALWSDLSSVPTDLMTELSFPSEAVAVILPRSPEQLAGGGDLRLDGVGAAEGPVGFAIPVLGVVEIALQRVHDAMQPGRFRGLVGLDDRVSLLPRSPFQKLDHLDQPILSRLRVHQPLHAFSLARPTLAMKTSLISMA